MEEKRGEEERKKPYDAHTSEALFVRGIGGGGEVVEGSVCHVYEHDILQLRSITRKIGEPAISSEVEESDMVVGVD